MAIHAEYLWNKGEPAGRSPIGVCVEGKCGAELQICGVDPAEVLACLERACGHWCEENYGPYTPDCATYLPPGAYRLCEGYDPGPDAIICVRHIECDSVTASVGCPPLINGGSGPGGSGVVTVEGQVCVKTLPGTSLDVTIVGPDPLPVTFDGEIDVNIVGAGTLDVNIVGPSPLTVNGTVMIDGDVTVTPAADAKFNNNICGIDDGVVIPVTIVDDPAPVVPDFEYACASDDGRVIISITTVVAGSVVTNLYEADGVTPVPAGVVAGQCASPVTYASTGPKKICIKESVDGQSVATDGYCVTTLVNTADTSDTITIYTDPTGAVVDPATISPIPCPDELPKEQICWKSADNVVGVDNTKTNFAHTYTIELVNNDGSTDQFVQTPTANFTTQIEQWATAMQAIYPGCVVEPRCNLPGGCGGLLPPPDGAALGGMFARYVSIICCPGAKYPVSASVIASPDIPVPRDLVMDGKQGLEKRGWLCQDCDGNQEWYDENWVPLDAANVPVCWFDCSETIPGAPELECTGLWTKACDNGVQDGDSFLQIDVLWDCCGGRVTLNDYFTEDNDGAAQPYEPVGTIVDCDTVGSDEFPKGMPIQPPSKCSPCEIIDSVNDLHDALLSVIKPKCSEGGCPDIDCANPRQSTMLLSYSNDPNSSLTSLLIGGANILPADIPGPWGVAEVQAAVNAAGHGDCIEVIADGTRVRLNSLCPCGVMIGGAAGFTTGGQLGTLWRIAVPSLPYLGDTDCEDQPVLCSEICNVNELAQAIAAAMPMPEPVNKPHIQVERICRQGREGLVPALLVMRFDCMTGALLGQEIIPMPDVEGALDCCTGEPIGGII